MRKCFVLFREGRRLRATHAELARLDAALLIAGRLFMPAGMLEHWSHITSPQKHLVGFAIHGLERATTSQAWRAWWDSFENRYLEDFFESFLFLTETIPADWHHDCAMLVGGWVYTDGAADFAIVVLDLNGYCFNPGEPAEFWTQIGFLMSTSAVALAN